MKKIRDHSIYHLPDGGRYVAIKLGDGNFLLYPCEPGASNPPPTYEITADGCLRSWTGEQVAWSVKDLVNSGRTFEKAEGAATE